MNNIVTIRLKDKEALVADALENFDFALDSEKGEVEVYRNNTLLGYYENIYGITVDELLDYIQNCYEQENNKIE